MQTELEEVKQIELNMLKQFITICKKHGLQYFLVGGTCLGAVRHKGFIPWDDDIDVGMPRNDYNCFLAVAQKDLPQEIFLQTHETDSEYPMNFAKLRNCNTTFIETSLKNFKINHGNYIDIFPLDGVPEGKIKQKVFYLKRQLYILRISQRYYTPQKNRKPLLKYLKKGIVNFAVNLACPNYQDTILRQGKLFQRYAYDKCKFVANHGGAWGKKEIMPKEYFGKGTKGIFEGMEVILPEKYHEYLSGLYGEYMKLPPEEKRIGHHYCEVIDCSKSYIQYGGK